MMTFLRNLAKLRSREETFIATLDTLRRALKAFAEELRKVTPGEQGDASLQGHLNRVDEHLYYQYTANVSVHCRLLGELIRHLFETADELLHRSPPALQSEAMLLALQCLEAVQLGLLEFRGRDARRAGAKAKRLQKMLTKIRRKGAPFRGLHEIVGDSGYRFSDGCPPGPS